MNTVTIDLKEYNDLRDFKETITKGGGVEICDIYSKGKFYTTDEELKRVLKTQNDLKDGTIEHLRDQLQIARDNADEYKSRCEGQVFNKLLIFALCSIVALIIMSKHI